MLNSWLNTHDVMECCLVVSFLWFCAMVLLVGAVAVAIVIVAVALPAAVVVLISLELSCEALCVLARSIYLEHATVCSASVSAQLLCCFTCQRSW